MLYIGFIILSLGVMMGDSDSLIIPTTLIAIGAVLMLRAQRREADDE